MPLKELIEELKHNMPITSEALVTEIENLVAALEFYSNTDNWEKVKKVSVFTQDGPLYWMDDSPVRKDQGRMARATLTQAGYLK